MDFNLQSGYGLLRRTPGELNDLLRDLPETWTMQDEGPGTWSPYQVVGHMLHLEEVDWLDRIQVILESDDKRPFRPIDREAGFGRFAGRSVNELLDEFALLRLANIAHLEPLIDQNDLIRRGRHPDFGFVTLGQLMATWVVHDLNHLNQIVKTMAKQYREAVGPWRAYLPIIDAK